MNIIDRAVQTGRGFTCLQTDDTANASDDSFVNLEEKMSKMFD